jgi:Fe-S-cluster containining protein
MSADIATLQCGSCTACCRSDMGVVLLGDDDVGSYDFIIAPAPADLVQILQATNPEALIPISELKSAPPEFLRLAKERGTAFAICELKRRDNGDCIYLGEAGCTIYDRRPSVCRKFDCRIEFLKQTRNERRDRIKSGMMSREVYAAARRRLPA